MTRKDGQFLEGDPQNAWKSVSSWTPRRCATGVSLKTGESNGKNCQKSRGRNYLAGKGKGGGKLLPPSKFGMVDTPAPINFISAIPRERIHDRSA